MTSPSLLPTHRQLLSDLVTTLYQPGSGREKSTENHVRLFPDRRSAASRSLMLTLHVLFPDVVLPALDLLDRGLVDRFRIVTPGEDSGLAAGCEKTHRADRKLASFGGAKADISPARDSSPHPIFTVRSPAPLSAQQAAVRDTSQPPKVYVVHLTAWSCSCKVFALDKFHGRADAARIEPGSSGQAAGLNRLLYDGEDVPCCKHLLACLLAETWGHANERAVTEQVMAAVVSGS